MPNTLRLLFLAGSAREASMNKRLARAAHDIAHKAGQASTFADLGDYPFGWPHFLEQLKAEAEQGV